MNEKMTVEDAIEIIQEYINQWSEQEDEAVADGEWGRAQSYKDIQLAAETLIARIERRRDNGY